MQIDFYNRQKIWQTVMTDSKKPPNTDVQTHWIDHCVTTVKVKIRHLDTLPLDMVKHLIEAKYEVTEIKATKTESLSFPGALDF
jgi:hypothetical protein